MPRGRKKRSALDRLSVEGGGGGGTAADPPCSSVRRDRAAVSEASDGGENGSECTPSLPASDMDEEGFIEPPLPVTEDDLRSSDDEKTDSTSASWRIRRREIGRAVVAELKEAGLLRKQPSPSSNRRKARYRQSLQQRAPSTDEVIDVVKKTEQYKMMLVDNEFIVGDDLDLLLLPELWDKVRLDIITALTECWAEKETQVKHRTKNYNEKRRVILSNLKDFNVPPRKVLSEVDAIDELRDCHWILGDEFFDAFAHLLKSARMGSSKSVAVLIAEWMVKSSPQPSKLVDAENLYYIVGYLLRSVQEEGKRRGKSSMARCLAGLASCRIDRSSKEAMKEARMKLPTGRTDRMDEFEGLIYPSAEFFYLFCRIEGVYRTSINTDTLLLEGPELLSRIREGFISDSTFTESKVATGRGSMRSMR